MRLSEQTADLYKALFAAQGEMPTITKDGDNPHFRSKYITLDSLWVAVRQVLQKHGLLCLQPPTHVFDGSTLTPNMVGVTTRIIHADSGQWVEDDLFLPLDKITPQAAGSALTYARRYSLASLLGIVADSDDDGEKAMERGNGPVTKKETTSDNDPIRAAVASSYVHRWEQMGVDKATIQSELLKMFGGTKLKDLTTVQVLKFDNHIVNKERVRA